MWNGASLDGYTACFHAADNFSNLAGCDQQFGI